MAKVSNKSVDTRRQRRSRLKRAVLPITELFGCTQMEAADRVRDVLLENSKLKSKILELEDKLLEAMTKLRDR